MVGPLSTVVGPQDDSGRQQAYCGPPPLYFQVSSIKLISFDDIYESLDQIARLNLHQEQFLAIGADHWISQKLGDSGRPPGWPGSTFLFLSCGNMYKLIWKQWEYQQTINTSLYDKNKAVATKGTVPSLFLLPGGPTTEFLINWDTVVGPPVILPCYSTELRYNVFICKIHICHTFKDSVCVQKRLKVFVLT